MIDVSFMVMLCLKENMGEIDVERIGAEGEIEIIFPEQVYMLFFETHRQT